jgi:hypothetical protein
MCLNDGNLIDDCVNSLEPGSTQFFVIQPRFMNVDIRINIDITEGEIDLQMAPNDDSFVVYRNQTNGFHEILLDSKYQWMQDLEDLEVISNYNITPFITTGKRSNSNVAETSTTNSAAFHVLTRVASDATLSTHITLKQSNSLLRLFGLKNRLVVTLPQNIHNLSGTRFFIAIRASKHAKVTTGLIFFTQEQLHIDLFVFFSVFFSCFFLFLAVCVVIWKLKQAEEMRRARY